MYKVDYFIYIVNHLWWDYLIVVGVSYLSTSWREKTPHFWVFKPVSWMHIQDDACYFSSQSI